jgi:hypothetical protein
VSSGIPAATSEPNVITRITSAISSPIAGDELASGGGASSDASSTCSPAARALASTASDGGSATVVYPIRPSGEMTGVPPSAPTADL